MQLVQGFAKALKICDQFPGATPVVKKPLPIGISDFKELIDGGYAYVDKTLLIEEIIENGRKYKLFISHMFRN